MDEQETTIAPEDTQTGDETQTVETTPEVTPEEVVPEVIPEVVPEEVAPAEPSDTDLAPEDVPVVHNDDGSVGRELDHVVNQ